MQNIKSFYTLFMIGTVISLVTTFILLGYFSTVEYGQYTLYLTYSSYLAILSFGYQDGMLMTYRQKKIEENIKAISFDLIFFILIQVIVMFICIFITFGKDATALFFAVIAMLPNILIIAQKQVLQATNKVIEFSLIDIMLKVSMFVGLIFIMFFQQGFITYLIIDVIIKYLVAIIGMIYFFYLYYKSKDIPQDPSIKFGKKSIINNFTVGFFLLVGNWFLVVTMGLDKVFLRGNEIDLGIYAIAMTVITLFISLLAPIKILFLTNINKDISHNRTVDIVYIFNIIGIILATGYSFIAYPILIHFDIKIIDQQSLYALRYLCILLPFIMSTQIILNNLIILKFNKRYPIINFVILVIFAIIYQLGIYFTSANWITISACTIIAYFFLYFINLWIVTNFKVTIKNILPIFIWIILYILVIKNIYLMLIYLVFIGIYAYKNWYIIDEMLISKIKK